MKTKIGYWMLSVFFVSTISFSQTVVEISQQTDEAMAKAMVPADYDPVIALLKEAATKNPSSYDMMWRASKAYGKKADLMQTTYTLENIKNAKPEDLDDVFDAEKDFTNVQRKELLALGIEARAYADKAVALNPDGVEGQFYSALGISMYSLGKSIVKALLEGLAGKFETATKNSIDKDKNFDATGPLRLMGRYYYKLPWPKRSLKKSEDWMRQAVQAMPSHLRNHLYLGDTLWELAKKDEAKTEWAKVVAANSIPEEKSTAAILEEIAKMKLSLAK